ncbi:MAG: hypothetical protein ACI31G_02090 [Bacilli bacterium]
MFQNPKTLWIEILILVIATIFVVYIFGSLIYKKTKHLPTGECEMCHKSTKKLLKKYRAYYGKRK